MGAVLRCLNCDGTLVRVVRTRYGYWLEMQGARSAAPHVAGVYAVTTDAFTGYAV